MKPSPEKDMSITTTTVIDYRKFDCSPDKCSHMRVETLVSHIPPSLIGSWQCALCGVEFVPAAPQPELGAGEPWRYEAMPIHGYRVLNENGSEIVRDIYSEEVAASIVDDHAIARTMPGLLKALHDARQQHRTFEETLPR